MPVRKRNFFLIISTVLQHDFNQGNFTWITEIVFWKNPLWRKVNTNCFSKLWVVSSQQYQKFAESSKEVKKKSWKYSHSPWWISKHYDKTLKAIYLANWKWTTKQIKKKWLETGINIYDITVRNRHNEMAKCKLAWKLNIRSLVG